MPAAVRPAMRVASTAPSPPGVGAATDTTEASRYTSAMVMIGRVEPGMRRRRDHIPERHARRTTEQLGHVRRRVCDDRQRAAPAGPAVPRAAAGEPTEGRHRERDEDRGDDRRHPDEDRRRRREREALEEIGAAEPEEDAQQAEVDDHARQGVDAHRCNRDGGVDPALVQEPGAEGEARSGRCNRDERGRQLHLDVRSEWDRFRQ